MRRACSAWGRTGGPVDPETEGTWNLDFDGADYSHSDSDNSYAAGWWNSSTGDLAVWIWTNFDYSGGSTQTGFWVSYLIDSTGDQTVNVYDYSGGTVTLYQSASSSAVLANLNPQTGTYYQGVGVGKITGSFEATVTNLSTSSTASVSVTNLDAVLYDYTNYAPNP